MSCSWSPDGRFIVTGGEDDLITVWSFCQQCVVARGSSHKSWISDIAFDPYQCTIPSDSDMKLFYNLQTVNEFVAARKASNNCTASSTDNLKTDETSTDKSAIAMTQRYKKLSLKDGLSARAQQAHCNGDSKFFSVASRLRTYSNVSRISRISLGPDAPSLCYRFGSVGQDALLCLWEIDENVVDFMRRKPSAFKRKEKSISKEKKKASSEHFSDSAIVAGSSSDLPVNGSYSSDHSSGGDHYYTHSQPPVAPADTSSALAASSRSSSVPHSINSSILSSKKDGQRSSKLPSSFIRKFATVGSHDRSRKESKQHKRNLSLPHFGTKNVSNANGNSGLQKNEQVK